MTTTKNTINHVVSFSGGRTSAYLAYLMKQKQNSGANVDFVFMDTGAEHPKTYDFIKRCNDYFDLKLTVLQPVISPELGVGVDYRIVDVSELRFNLGFVKSLMAKHGGFSVNKPLCTDRFKSVVNTKYCERVYGKGAFIKWLGIRADEPRRLKRENRSSGGLRYLADLSDYEKSDILNFWQQMPFDLGIQEHLGNCIFCVKKTPVKVALAARDEPELWNEWVDAVTDSDNVRTMPSDKFGVGHIYRNWASPEQVIGMFSDLTTDELRERVYKSRGEDIGGCSESCEGLTEQLGFDL